MQKKLRVFVFLFLLSLDIGFTMTVAEFCKTIKIIQIPDNARPVDYTVATVLRDSLMPEAIIMASAQIKSGNNADIFCVGIADEGLIDEDELKKLILPKGKDWFLFRLTDSGKSELIASRSHLLYAAYCKIVEEWIHRDSKAFAHGNIVASSFRWLEGGDGFFGTRVRFARHYDPESAIREFARMGCSHVSANPLAPLFPYEEGPPGEIYYRFYVSNPDLDQYVETDMNRGTYPPEYLQANLNFLKKNVQLAVKYGLTPGLTMYAPRSIPESFFFKYPFLRGARIDHTFRSYQPRYTMTLAHPVVRWHYAQLMKKLMQQVPELGYVRIGSNDSGAGFEYCANVYAGRNGGPYLIREWKSNEEIARAAGENILRYYRTLRDAAAEINPNFRVITGLYSAEAETLLNGMDERIDLNISLADTMDRQRWQKIRALTLKGCYLFGGAGLTSNYVLGVPFPWLAHDRLEEMVSGGLDRISVSVHPPSLAPYDINRKILQEFQIDQLKSFEEIINAEARRLVGDQSAPQLVKVWRLSDQVVRAFPDIPLYPSFGFVSLRLWVRPFVANIDAISEQERAYYEDFLLATFNNPTRVDMAVDALWTLITTELGDKVVKQCAEIVWQPLDQAINSLEKAVQDKKLSSVAHNVFVDQHDRLIGLKCYFRTLRNLAAWVAGVHGYVDAQDEHEKARRLRMVREMMADEIVNTRELAKLWQNSKTDFMSIYSSGETWFAYGENFGQLLEKKLKLMEEHVNDLPFLDPNYMWRMPTNFPVAPEEYLKY